MKRCRTPKAKPGELKAQWGKLPRDTPDLVYVWGDGIPKCDGALLHYALTGKQYDPITRSYEDGFLAELQKRGYDITTLRFSIQKSPEGTPR